MGWIIDLIWKFVSFWIFSKLGIFGRIVIGIAILNRLIKGLFAVLRIMGWFMG